MPLLRFFFLDSDVFYCNVLNEFVIISVNHVSVGLKPQMPKVLPWNPGL